MAEAFLAQGDGCLVFEGTSQADAQRKLLRYRDSTSVLPQAADWAERRNVSAWVPEQLQIDLDEYASLTGEPTWRVLERALEEWLASHRREIETVRVRSGLL